MKTCMQKKGDNSLTMKNYANFLNILVAKKNPQIFFLHIWSSNNAFFHIVFFFPVIVCVVMIHDEISGSLQTTEAIFTVLTSIYLHYVPHPHNTHTHKCTHTDVILLRPSPLRRLIGDTICMIVMDGRAFSFFILFNFFCKCFLCTACLVLA